MFLNIKMLFQKSSGMLWQSVWLSFLGSFGAMNVVFSCNFSWDPIYLHVFAGDWISILYVNFRGILSIYMYLQRTERIFYM